MDTYKKEYLIETCNKNRKIQNREKSEYKHKMNEKNRYTEPKFK